MRNAARLGNPYQCLNLITCTDGLFRETHLFYLFNSFDCFNGLALSFATLLKLQSSAVGAACGGRHGYEGKRANGSAFAPQPCPLPRPPILRGSPRAPSWVTPASRSLCIQVGGCCCCYLTAIEPVVITGLFSSLCHVLLSPALRNHMGYPSLIKGKLRPRG